MSTSADHEHNADTLELVATALAGTRYTNYQKDKFYANYHENVQQPSHDITLAEIIAATPHENGQSPIEQTAQTEDIQFGYDIILVKRIRVFGKHKIFLPQMQELQKRFEDQGFQIQQCKYIGVFDMDENEVNE